MILQRLAWVFKIESLLMPAFLDAVGASAMIRGLMPVLGRLGYSAGPLLTANWVEQRATIAPILALTSLWQAIPWLLLGVAPWVWPNAPMSFWVGSFLLAYTLSWGATGTDAMVGGTLQGKLLPLNWLGRLMGIANLVGCLLACLATWWLVGRWLRLDQGAAGFSFVFIAVGIMSGLAALVTQWFREPVSEPRTKNRSLAAFFRQAYAAISDDQGFRQLLVTATLYYALLVLLPHFQSLAQQRLGLSTDQLVLWIICQNLGNALGSSVFGIVADRYGTGKALGFVLAILASTPLVALGATELGGSGGRILFSLVFFLLGVAPVAGRFLQLYTVQWAAADVRPRYLAALNCWQVMTLLVAPLVGLLIDQTGFALAFLIGSGCLAVAAVSTFWLHRPAQS